MLAKIGLASVEHLIGAKSLTETDFRDLAATRRHDGDLLTSDGGQVKQTCKEALSIHVGLEQLRSQGVAGVADPETQRLVSNDKFVQDFLALYKKNKGEVRNSLMVNLLHISVSKCQRG